MARTNLPSFVKPFDSYIRYEIENVVFNAATEDSTRAIYLERRPSLDRAKLTSEGSSLNDVRVWRDILVIGNWQLEIGMVAADIRLSCMVPRRLVITWLKRLTHLNLVLLRLVEESGST